MIRLATVGDLPEIMRVYETARSFMRKTGNPTQWQGGYPQQNIVLDDIDKQQLYVLENDGLVRGAFAFLAGPDSTYLKIYDGSWQSDAPYFAIHRVASDGTVKGFFSLCADFCKKKCPHLRIDTHADNLVMQKAVQKAGFRRCGIIYLENGDPRIAYEFIQ